MDSIFLTDENNKSIEFKIIKTFGVDNKDYAALEPIGEDFILILEMIKTKDEISFKSIDNQDELNEIIDIYEEMERE